MGSGEERRMKQSIAINSSSDEITRVAYIHLRKGNSQRATECFESAAEKAKEEGDAVVMISCYLNAGACLVSRGQLSRGNDLLLSALKLAKMQKLDDSVSRTTNGKESQVSMMEISADIYYNLAIAAQQVQKFKKAILYLKTSADFYLKTGCVLHAAESYSNRASCHKRVKERHKEVACLVTAQQLYHESGDGYKEAESCLELARTYLRENLMDDCKEMLSTAKLLCLRINNRGLQGKLYTQFGLIYTSMGHYDLGIQNFERALPLVREEVETEQSLQAEASLLQNIGAAYNEKALFLEAMVYHKEAVTIHGKVHNHNSESKSLCNLAYAQTQLNQLHEAAKTFSNALTKAYQAKNSFLQFQTCEGLGSINHQVGKFDEAVSCFRQALSILDQIREDTGIARERVMEKLSETTEALQTLHGREGESLQSTGEEEVQVREVIRSQLHSIASTSDEYTKHLHPSRSKSLPCGEHTRDRTNGPRSAAIVGEGSFGNYDSVPVTTGQDELQKKVSITERRGAKSLPPIRAKGPELATHKHAVLASKKGKQKLRHSEAESGGASDYSADLQTYMNSYLDSNTASISSWSQDVQRQLAGLPAVPPGTRTVREGSLAIGENARDTFTVQTIQEWSRGKRGKKKHRTRSQIIHLEPSPMTTSNSEEAQRPGTSSQPKNQSKICTIL